MGNRNSQSSRHPACRTSSSSHRDSTSMAARSEAANQVRSNGGSNKAQTQAYTAGNKWATENAKAVGNL